MKQRTLIVGAGFADMWSALSAVRQLNRQGRDDVKVVVLVPQPELYIHPRFYEPDVQRITAPLDELFAVVGVYFVQGSTQHIDVAGKRVEYRDTEGTSAQLDYSRLVLAAGSDVWCPANVVGVDAAFDVDQLGDALRLETHLHALRDLPDSPARSTVVVVDGGSIGIETATEMPVYLRAIPGEKTALRAIVVNRGVAIGTSMGAGLSGLIAEASVGLGVKRCLRRSVTVVSAEGVTPDGGQRIEVKTVIRTVGMRVSTSIGQIPDECGAQGRLHVDRNLKALGFDGVYAAGGVVRTTANDLGNHTLMTCRHAIALGRSAGNNVAADLFGVEPIPYNQVKYVTCLNLGGWGAVFTESWDRRVRLVREEDKKIKTEINGMWIYPPAADRAVALAAADPLIPVVAQGGFPPPQPSPVDGRGCRAVQRDVAAHGRLASGKVNNYEVVIRHCLGSLGSVHLQRWRSTVGQANRRRNEAPSVSP